MKIISVLDFWLRTRYTFTILSRNQLVTPASSAFSFFLVSLDFFPFSHNIFCLSLKFRIEFWAELQPLFKARLLENVFCKILGTGKSVKIGKQKAIIWVKYIMREQIRGNAKNREQTGVLVKWWKQNSRAKWGSNTVPNTVKSRVVWFFN